VSARLHAALSWSRTYTGAASLRILPSALTRRSGTYYGKASRAKETVKRSADERVPEDIVRDETSSTEAKAKGVSWEESAA
jgi:hypothetical protein